MTTGGPVPEALLTLVAGATVFTVMLSLGCRIELREFRWIWHRPGVLARGLFTVLVAVPAIALVVARAFDLPRAADIGVVLMAISPGAPVALRRSLDAGGHRAFAPALQILIAMLAVISMPLSIIALDELYVGQAAIGPGAVARQVFMAQLLPLGLGMSVRRGFPELAGRCEPALARLARYLLLALTVLAIVSVWHVVVGAGPRVVLAIMVVTLLALAAGHLMGGPQAGTRTAVAISSAARNPGLALLVVTLNHASPEIRATVLVYIVVSALTVAPYLLWRRRGSRPESTGSI